MPWSRRRAVTTISIIYLIILAAIAAYALHTIRHFSLPIPTLLSSLTLALPFISGLSLEILTRVQERQVQKAEAFGSRYYMLTIAALLIYETAVATLSGTYIGPPNTLTCGLDERWKRLFHTKDRDGIRTIQDALDCCGLHSTVDMAYPFPSRGVGADACGRTYGRTRSCFSDWRAEEQLVAGLMLLVVFLVFVWKSLIVFWQTRSTSWMAGYRQTGGDAEEPDDTRRMLGYRDVNEEEHGRSAGRSDGEGVPSSRVQPSRLHDQPSEWAEEQ